MIRFILFVPFLLLTTVSCLPSYSEPPKWVHQVDQQVKKIEKTSKAEFGIYIEDLESGALYSRGATDFWYLSSTVKVPVAIGLLQLVDRGQLKLSEKVVVKRTDYRDGAGPVNWLKLGTKVTYKYLLNQMLKHSDNAATDLLIRRVGLKNINQLVLKHIDGKEFGPITTLLDVRKKAYSEFHPRAAQLSALDFFSIKKKRAPEKKLNELARLLKVKRSSFQFENLNSGFQKYYSQNWNSAPLVSYAELLKQLLAGRILNPSSTKLLIEIMSRIHTGKKRILAGLPKTSFFAHKTGTQLRQACDMGVAGRKEDKKPRVLVLVCVKNWKKLSHAERIMANVGRAIARTELL